MDSKIYFKTFLFFLMVITSASANASIEVTDLLESDSRSAKLVMFQQSASSGTDATTVAKITLAYFTSSDCTGSKAGSGFYTTPDGTSFTIALGTAFGMVAASAWNVGNTTLSIADMTTIQSIAVTFKSTNSSTPQAAFTNGSAQVISYACVPVTCSSGECTSGSGTQSFTLKTTAAVGDPADGGVIGCQNTGSSPNLYDLVIATSDQSTAIAWGGSGTATGATSATDGAANTATIYTALGAGSSYPARICAELGMTGGWTTNWFLPSGNTAASQVSCLYGNRTAIATGAVAAGGAGCATGTAYWTSTESSSTNAYNRSFLTGSSQARAKTATYLVRCVRNF